jgi:undecaprenyl-diphosphatase
VNDFYKFSYVRILLLVALSVSAVCTSAAADEDYRKQLSPTHAVILGIVEGITEYLPVSSTGHLLITKDLIGLGSGIGQPAGETTPEDDAINAYIVCIQFGAILAILFVCFHRFRKIFNGVFHGDSEGRRLLGNLVLALLPAVVAGLILGRIIKTHLFGAYPVIAAWFFGGVVILAVSFWYRRRGKNMHKGQAIEDMRMSTAVLIGVAQCFAMWPGLSRSLATILGAIFLGLSMKAAVEFSFLLGAVTLTAATVYDVVTYGGEMLATLELSSMALGLLFAFVSAVLSVKWMIRYLNRYGLEVFGYYRIAIALAGMVIILA